MPTSALLLLLRHAKYGCDHTWQGTAAALAPNFFKDMALTDVMAVMVYAYEEALSEPRFCIGSGRAAAVGLLLAPIKGPASLFGLKSQRLDDTFSVEAFYNTLVQHILSEFRLAVVGWIPDFKKEAAK